VAGTLPVVVALVIAAGTAVLFHRLAQKLVDDPELVSWLTLAFFFGTGYWYVLGQSSGVWFFAHVVGVPLILLAYNEALGRGREILVGLFVGLAFLTRQMYLASAIFLAVLLWEQAADRPRSTRVLRLLRFGLPVVLCLTLYLLFNAVRFGNPLDTGYAYFDFVDFLRPRMERFGLISLAYVPFNFSYLFVQGFHVNFARPMLLSPSEMDGLGTAITFASPFLGAAFFARWNRRVLIAAWVSVVVVVAYLLVYFVNGWAQVNTQRYTLDFVPLLMILTALGLGQVNLRLWKAAIVYAVLLNVLALVLVPIAIALIGRRF
jgi:hypothetical protein